MIRIHRTKPWKPLFSSSRWSNNNNYATTKVYKNAVDNIRHLPESKAYHRSASLRLNFDKCEFCVNFENGSESRFFTVLQKLIRATILWKRRTNHKSVWDNVKFGLSYVSRVQNFYKLKFRQFQRVISLSLQLMKVKLCGSIKSL